MGKNEWLSLRVCSPPCVSAALFLGDDNIHYIYLGVAHYKQHLHCTDQSNNNTMFAATDLTVVIVKLIITIFNQSRH